MNYIFKTYGRHRNMTHKLTDFSPKPSVLHVVISLVIRFDKSLYPVVLYEKYAICIFMISCENLENDEKIIGKLC